MENPTGERYEGKAPEPRRKIALGADHPNIGTEVSLPTVTEEGVHVGDSIYAVPTPKFSESPAPKDPEKAVVQATTEDRIGELTQALGEQKKQHDLALQEMALKHESELAALASQANVNPASFLPQGIDPNQAVKAGELMVMLQKIVPYLDEKITRSGWDITPEEESAVLQANPHFANITDGAKRVECILRAVQLSRERNGSPKTTPSSSAPQAASESASKTRALKRVVPHVEGSIAPIAPDLSPENVPGDIARRYEEAKNIPDKTLRLATMKKIYKESQAAQGISDEALSKAKFIHTT